MTSAAVMLVGIATALLTGGDIGGVIWPLALLWIGSTLVFVVFSAHLVRRLVIGPLERLLHEAEALSAGRVPESSPDYASLELDQLAARYRAMAADLLDVQGHVVRVEKLAGIGTLAAGVAHEVRNPLGALANYVDLLRRQGGHDALAEAMRGAIGRIDRTVQSLLAYAHPGAAPGTVDLGEAVKAGLEAVAAQGLLRTQDVRVSLESGLGVRGDRHLLEQVVVNLVVNACQAAPGGVLAVGTVRHAYEAGPAGAARRADVGPAPDRERSWRPRPRPPEIVTGTEGALLYVADDGAGVPEEDRERIFDPFHTTKDPGAGTGLGLAIVARTVYEVGGTVWVDRAREGGAVFKLFLPLVPARTAPAREPSYALAHR